MPAPADRQEATSLAGLWPGLTGGNHYIEVCGTHDGFVPTSDVTDAAGWASVGVRCF